jgi:hypothetical protein
MLWVLEPRPNFIYRVFSHNDGADTQPSNSGTENDTARAVFFDVFHTEETTISRGTQRVPSPGVHPARRGRQVQYEVAVGEVTRLGQERCYTFPLDSWLLGTTQLERHPRDCVCGSRCPLADEVL